ncbi:LPXTG cell wall anchor domain-containing protein [Bifidobacterium pullorum subsp. saeculare]|uniref:LPXTG cell wall anchor domain-containing protein n=1 Tax=Bifidobacterium pullorum subsp. saeculare TaxID=78257 RepID=A0A939B920_9BIFI|nr:LPXTG cell wall anchor domain-containing protein [Bifidobacterium pullorum]MBM6700472.1 LPXTG cell wall anchor domain-containing protein [Bifidobacterium pullorum subsp. saeculare]
MPPDTYWQTALPTMTVTVAGGKVSFAATTDTFGLVTVDNTTDENNGTATVKNIRNITQLPLTGAAGIAMFTVVGLLVLGAGVGVYVKSRSTRKAMMA